MFQIPIVKLCSTELRIHRDLLGLKGGLSQREVATPFSIPLPPDWVTVGDTLVLLSDCPAQIDQKSYPFPNKLSR